jgi:hypothetical protein
MKTHIQQHGDTHTVVCGHIHSSHLALRLHPRNAAAPPQRGRGDLPILRPPREYLEALVLIRAVVVLLVLVLRLLRLLRRGGEGRETSRMPRDVPVAY